jgi:hypothetical protein
MAEKKYCVLIDETNIIENIIILNDSNATEFEENVEGKSLVLDDESEFSSIGCEYVNGYFQPIDPTKYGYEGWIKEEDGVWDKIKTKPEKEYFWNPLTNDWMLLSDTDAASTLAELGVDINFITQNIT